MNQDTETKIEFFVLTNTKTSVGVVAEMSLLGRRDPKEIAEEFFLMTTGDRENGDSKLGNLVMSKFLFLPEHYSGSDKKELHHLIDFVFSLEAIGAKNVIDLISDIWLHGFNCGEGRIKPTQRVSYPFGVETLKS